MNKQYFFLIPLLFYNIFGIIAQNDSTSKKGHYMQKEMKYIESRNIVFNHKIIPNYFSKITSVGYQTNRSYCINRFYYTYSSISFNQSLPIEVTINDSLMARSIGSNANILTGIDLLNINPKYDILVLFGFEFGRLRLYNNPLLRKKNGYFAPKIELQPKFKLKRLVLGGSFGYGYDISNPNWKDTWLSKGPSLALDKLRQSGFSYQFFIGWSFY